MEPVDTLERIALEIERSGGSTYRVRAFRGAARQVAGIEAGELADRAGRGTLTDLPAVGKTTAEVIAQVLAGQPPDYLRKLEDEARDSPVTAALDAAAADQPAAELRAALRGDLHSHSDWSDGGSPIGEMAMAARDLGHDYLALTDHSPRLTVAGGLSADRLRRQLDVVAELNTRLAPFRILTGIEVDILADGSLDQQAELLDRLDVVVASAHSKLAMPRREMTRRLVAAASNPLVRVLGHCTGRLLGGRAGGKQRAQSDFDPGPVFEACARHGTAVEINSRPERLDPPRRLLGLALAAGCEFAIDSDAHAPGQLDWQPLGCVRAAACGVPADRIINTRGPAALVSR